MNSDLDRNAMLASLHSPISGVTLGDMDNAFLLGKEACPACESPYVVPVRYVFTDSLASRLLLRCCIDCRSFWIVPAPAHSEKPSPSNWLPHHKNVEERNIGYAQDLFTKIAAYKNFSSVLEIGCGTGTALKVAANLGKKVCGYDTDPVSIAHGCEAYAIALQALEWNSSIVLDKYDLVLSNTCS